jgi:hypothetical protein
LLLIKLYLKVNNFQHFSHLRQCFWRLKIGDLLGFSGNPALDAGLYLGYPHPWGFLGDPTRECSCTYLQVQRYRSKLSGPLLDGIDIHMEAPPAAYKDLSSTATGVT